MKRGRRFGPLGAAFLALASGCLWTKVPKSEDSGWFVAPAGRPFTTLEDYKASVVRSDLEGCPDGPITIAVPGYWGDGVEWPQAAAFWRDRFYVYRWSPNADANVTLHELIWGVDRLAACPGPVFLVGHSAGGILVSLVAGELAPVAEGHVTIFTASAPLAGTGTEPSKARPGEPMSAHMNEMMRRYAPPSPGVRAVHLRTNPLVDAINMAHFAHDPIDPTVGIPGAVLIDVPRSLGHDPALIWTAERIGDGRWTDWFDPSVELSGMGRRTTW
jgi:Alpha/beta hydrolase family